MSYASQPFLQYLGLALLHFIWQGGLIAILLAGMLSVTKSGHAGIRYVLSCWALALMLLAPVVTVYLMASRSNMDTASNEGPKANRADNQSTPGTIAEVKEDTSLEQRNRPLNGAGNSTPASYLRFMQRAAIALPWVVYLWMAGVLLLFFRLTGGWLVSRRLRRLGLRSCPALWNQALDDLRLKAGISQQVRLSISALVQVPTVIGWLHPIILVPTSVFTGLTPEQLRALLLHELAHIRRYDYLVNVFQTVTETLLFYHPAVWWVSKRIRTEREHACDDVAVSICGDSLVYARALTIVEEMRLEGRPLAFTMAADGGSLVRRIRRLVSPGVYQRESRSLASVILSAIVAITFVAGLLSFAKADGLTRAAIVVPDSRRTVAVTFVSLPPLRYGDIDFSELQDINTRLVDRITAHHIPAVGFVGENRVQIPDAEERRTALLRTWIDAGLELGNQTYSHPKLYNTPVEEFEEDIIRGETVTRRLMEEHGRRLRYFSFPYLNTGRDQKTKDEIDRFLSQRGYTVHKVTIDSDEYMYSSAYGQAKARGDRDAMQRVRAEYLPYMERMFEFFEGISREITGREIPQVLMLTASALNADCFDELVAMMQRRGYSFVSLEQAMKDEAYQQPDTYFSPYGFSWLQHWAVTKGGLIRREPDPSEFIENFDKRLKAGAKPKFGV